MNNLSIDINKYKAGFRKNYHLIINHSFVSKNVSELYAAYQAKNILLWNCWNCSFPEDLREYLESGIAKQIKNCN